MLFQAITSASQDAPINPTMARVPATPRCANNAEISEKALDLRGLLDALRLIRRGVGANRALDMGITNKAFDSYEQSLIRDVIAARIPAKLDRSRLFTD